MYHYKKEGGKPLSTTLGMQAERLAPGASSGSSQDSSSFIYHCVEGKGRTISEAPNQEKAVFAWASRDTFAVPV